MIIGREKSRSNIYESFEGSNRVDGRRREFHIVEPQFLKVLKCGEVSLKYRDIRRGVF